MTLRTIAFRNLRRRKVRSAFLIAGLVIGIATIVTLLSLTRAMTGQAKTSMQSFGANILITPATKDVTLTYAGVDLGGASVGTQDLDEASLAAIDTIAARKDIAIVAPELVGGVETKGHRVLLMGVQPAEQFRLKKWWSIDAGRPPANDHELVAGAGAARTLELQMGDYLRIQGRRFTVTGLLRPTGAQDDNLLIADLGAVQRVLHKPGKVSMIEIAARSADSPIDELAAQLAAVLPVAKVAAMQEAVKSSQHTVGQFKAFSYAIVAVVLGIEVLVVFVTMMGSVNERAREIGVFRALGFSGSHVVRLILIEAAVASTIAGLLGYVVGMSTSYAVLPMIADRAHIAWTPALAAAAVALAFGVGSLASLYPALHASRLDPTEAMRAL